MLRVAMLIRQGRYRTYAHVVLGALVVAISVSGSAYAFEPMGPSVEGREYCRAVNEFIERVLRDADFAVVSKTIMLEADDQVREQVIDARVQKKGDLRRLSYFEESNDTAGGASGAVYDVACVDGALLLWDHMGLPGHVGFGLASEPIGQTRMRGYEQLMDPELYFGSILRILSMEATLFTPTEKGDIVATFRAADVPGVKKSGSGAPGDDDRLEIVLSKDVDFLPESMMRYMPRDDDESRGRLKFKSGSGIRVKYMRLDSGQFFPSEITEDRPLHPGATGRTRRELILSDVDQPSRLTRETATLRLAEGVEFLEFGSNDSFRLGDDPKRADRVRKLFGDTIMLTSPEDAVEFHKATHAARAPFIREVSADSLRGTRVAGALVSRSATRLPVLLAINVVAILIASAAFLFIRRRRARN